MDGDPNGVEEDRTGFAERGGVLNRLPGEEGEHFLGCLLHFSGESGGVVRDATGDEDRFAVGTGEESEEEFTLGVGEKTAENGESKGGAAGAGTDGEGASIFGECFSLGDDRDLEGGFVVLIEVALETVFVGNQQEIGRIGGQQPGEL